MAFISIVQVKIGDRIIQDVMTHKNNLLMNKGTVVSERELEVLRAFLIAKVHVESEKTSPDGVDSANAQGDSNDSANTLTGTGLKFNNAYDEMVTLLKKVFLHAYSAGTISALEVRNGLEKLLSNVDYYNLVSFRPTKYHLQDYLIHHSIKTSLSSYLLAKWIGFTQKDLIPIALGGLLHDIGNVKIDSTLLMKPSMLSNAEYEEVKRHTSIGYQILKSVAGLNEGSKLTTLQHHERLDGSGYPLGLKGDTIHPYSRVVAITDVYHAMTSPRTHQLGMSPYIVMEELSKESFGKLDPVFVQTFIRKVTDFHTGMIVKLNDNRIGEIVFSQREHPTRPWVSVNGTIINLSLERSLHIQEVIQ